MDDIINTNYFTMWNFSSYSLSFTTEKLFASFLELKGFYNNIIATVRNRDLNLCYSIIELCLEQTNARFGEKTSRSYFKKEKKRKKSFKNDFFLKKKSNHSCHLHYPVRDKSSRDVDISSVAQSCPAICDPMDLQHTRLP